MSSKNTSIALGDKLEQFTDQQVASGAYASRSEVIRAGLRLLAEREAKLEALEQALAEGLASPAVEFDFDAFMKERFGSECTA